MPQLYSFFSLSAAEFSPTRASRTTDAAYQPVALKEPAAVSNPAAGNSSSLSASVDVSTNKAPAASPVAPVKLGRIWLIWKI